MITNVGYVRFDNKLYFTIEALIRILANEGVQVKVRTLQRMAHKEEIDAIMVGRTLLINRDDINSYYDLKHQ